MGFEEGGASSTRSAKMLRLICFTCCLVSMASGKPLKPVKYHKEDLLEMVERAVDGGMGRALDGAKEMVSSDYDALEASIKSAGFKAKKALKEPNAEAIKGKIDEKVLGVQGREEENIFKAVKAAVCGKDSEKHLKAAVEAFENLLDNIRDSILMEAAGPYLDSIEGYIDAAGTVDFDEEERKVVKTIDDEGDIIVQDFLEELRQAVKIIKGKYEGCKNKDDKVGSFVDTAKRVDEFLDMLKVKLQRVRVAAS